MNNITAGYYHYSGYSHLISGQKHAIAKMIQGPKKCQLRLLGLVELKKDVQESKLKVLELKF
jgi:hypothetical protein